MNVLPGQTSPGVLLVGTLMLLTAACGGGSGNGDDGNGGGQTTPQANQPPRANISASRVQGFVPLTVNFDAAASSDADGSVTRYRWDFGDGSPTAGVPSVSHTFDSAGAYIVTLEVTDDDGATDTATSGIDVVGATVSGMVQIATGSSVDSDVNDRLTTPVGNNSFGAAQPLRDPASLGAPMRLGGFVNLPGTGSTSGNFFSAGDTEDFYVVDLQGGEHVILSIGEANADLDLELYDSGSPPMLLDSSVSSDPANDPTEDLTVQGPPGQYFIRVVAVSGASSYLLSIDDGVQTTALRRRAKRLSDDFVPGEVLMMAAAGNAPVRRLGITRAGGAGFRLEPLDRRDTAPDLRMTPIEIAAGAMATAQARSRYRTLDAARRLATRADVAFAEVNALRRPLRTPNDPLYGYQWHYPAIDLQQAWDTTTGDASPSVIVAVVDTGVLLDHPDLTGKLYRNAGQVVGYDFIQDPQRANDGDGIDPNPDDPGDSSAGNRDGSYHGTHVAGTVGADSDNGTGVAGVSWGARIMPLRALGIDGGTTFDVLQAVRYAARLSNNSGTLPPRRADVVNLSLGSEFFSEAEQQTLNQVRAQGVFVVASAGNDSSSVPTYPASYDGVISVSATTITNARALYSNFGPRVDVAAPGGDSLDRNGDSFPDAVASTLGAVDDDTSEFKFTYALLQGTSMAAPHVSGVIALMKSVHPELTPAQFDALLQSGDLTNDAGPPGRDDQYGYGIINASKAVLAAQLLNNDDVGPIISPSVGTLDFQAFTRQLAFAVTNVGDAPVDITVSDDAPWLDVVQPIPSVGGFGQYQATVDRTGLGDGSYQATITFSPQDDPNVSPATVTVLMAVTSPDLDADAGQHYVVLIDAQTQETRALDVVTAQSGQYPFTLEDVNPGTYLIYAGTDLDDDDLLCDSGETCGAFPSLSSPQSLTVDPASQVTVEGLVFASEFQATAAQPPQPESSPPRSSQPGASRGGAGTTIPIDRTKAP